MHRFFCDINLQNPSVEITSPEEIHHIRTVLRLHKGAAICLFNKDGDEAYATLTSVTSRKISAQVDRCVHPRGGGQPGIILACAIPKKAKFELIVEKATEIGVTEIIPIITQRTEIRLTDERAGKKQSRYEKIAINAAKQSQRNTVPEIHPCQTFSDAVSRIPRAGTCVIPWLGGEKKSLPEVLMAGTPHTSIIVFIGPEGDFSPREVEQAVQAGAIPVSLGKNVLKVDTAAIVSVTLIRFYLDNAQ